MPLKILATPSFARVAKRLHAKDKKIMDQAVKDIADDPALGEEKKGDLLGIFVHKFKLNNQETLLAYRLNPDKRAPEEIVLLAVGPHENFYPHSNAEATANNRGQQTAREAALPS